MDDDRQRSQRGKRRRYFLAAVLRRERDGRLRRWRIDHLRLPESAATHSRFGQLSRIPLDVASEHFTGETPWYITAICCTLPASKLT